MAGGFGNTWGSTWGSGSGPGGVDAIPTSQQWDLFDLSGVVRDDDIDRLPTYTEVSLSGDGGAFFVGSFNIASGGIYPSTTAALIIDVAVSETFTVQYQVKLNNLPPDFSQVTQGVACGVHAYLGVWSSQDFAAGFFISAQGFAYTGEVSLDGNGDVVPAQAVNQIPGSDTWVAAGKEYVIRVVVDPDTQLLYLYVTPLDQVGGGLDLKAILVAIPTASPVSDNAFISARGSVSETVWLELNNYQLSSRKILPDLPPVANAGNDQALLKCSVLQLDGSASFDPEGAALSYEWRLVDAPITSAFVFTGGDGVTLAETLPTGYTDEFYSLELQDEDTREPIRVNDVLTVPAGSFTIKQIARTPLFFVRVEYVQLPQNSTGIQFKLVRQNSISGPDTIKPTFYPDVVGFYVFDLRVGDGTSSSSPLGTGRSRVLTNVIESPLPRGCEVDASFVFDSLLSFWKLVEDRDKLATFWEALSRVTATELYTLWQTEYAKSLRDIQRVFVRRWLHYDTLLPEPSPELTSLRFLWGGITSSAIPVTGAVGVASTYVVVTSPFLLDPVTLPLTLQGAVPPESYAQELQARLRETLGPSVRAYVWWARASVTSADLSSVSYPSSVTLRTLTVSVDGSPAATATIGTPATASELVAELAAQLVSVSVTLTPTGALRVASKVSDPASSVVIGAGSTLLDTNGGPLVFTSLSSGSEAYIHLDANIPFTLTSASSAPYITYPSINTVAGRLSGGYKVGDTTLKVPVSLASLPVKEDDLLVIDRTSYRIVRVLDNPDDPLPFQRVVVKETLPASPAGGSEWIIPGWVESTFLDFWNGLVDRGDAVDFEVTVPSGDQYVTRIASATALGVNGSLVGRLAINTAELATQLSTDTSATNRLARVLRRRFLPIDDLIVDIPVLTDVIEVTDEDSVLRRNVDFFLETFRGHHSIRFSSGVGSDLGDVWEGDVPPPRLWAEYTHVNNEEMVESNFGAAIGLTRDKVPDTVDYLSAVRGIWYALYNGPSIQNLRISLQIFLGLPFAEESGIIEEIRTDYFTQKGRIIIRDSSNAEIIRSYTFPRTLPVEKSPVTGVLYKVGDYVEQFAPLVAGAEVIDWITDPTWFEGILQQGIFYEVQKYHSFLVRVNSEAFNLESLLFAQQFIQKIKPTHTNPLYVVSVNASGDGDEIDVIDTVEYAASLYLVDSVCDRMGASTVFDEPWPSGSTYGESARNAFDTDDDPTNPPPVYPGPPDLVSWGFDKDVLCPADSLEAAYCELVPPGSLPAFDGAFAYDVGLVAQTYTTLAPPSYYPSAPQVVFTAVDPGVLVRLAVLFDGPTGTPSTQLTSPTWRIDLLNGTVVVASVPFSIGFIHPVDGLVITMPQNLEILSGSLGIQVSPGDVFSVVVTPVGTSLNQYTDWVQIVTAVAVSGGLWAFDTPFAGGVQCAYGEVT